MLAPTHSVFGIFLTLIILAVFGVQWGLHWSIILFAILGSIIPDIDHPRSLIGKIFGFISVPLERKYGHRTITHSLFGLILSTVLFSTIILLLIGIFKFICHLDFDIWNFTPRWIAAFSISYFSHLVLDMFNKRGSQMFWPDPGRDVIPRNPKFRPDSGSKVEVLTFFVLLALMFLAFPISKYGIASSLRWLLATPGSAIEEFKTIKTHTYLDFSGIVSETREPISGKAEILDVNNKRLIIFFKGNVYSLSDELAADIFASHVRAKKTNSPIKTERREFKDKSREYLLSQIPTGAIVSGVVHLPEDMQITFPVNPSGYKTLEQKGNDLVLSFASKKQIENLALNQSFDLQTKKDRAELSRLYADEEKIKVQINEAKSGQGLTPLGRKLLVGNEETEKKKVQLAELSSQLEGNNVKIEELKLKIKARKFVFSGEVYLRQ